MKISVGVMTCKKYKNRYDTIKSTWGGDFGDRIFYFGGDQSDPDEIIKLDYPDTYPSILYIQHDIYKYLYEKHPDSDWYCVINDDGMLIRKNLEHILEKYNPDEDLYLGTSHYRSDYLSLGFYVKDKNSEYKDVDYASGGPGFFISNSLIKKMYPRVEEMLKTWIENCDVNFNLNKQFIDAGLGYQLYKMFKIRVTDINTEDYRLYTQRPSHHLQVEGYLASNPAGFHYIGPQEMVEIYKNYK